MRKIVIGVITLILVVSGGVLMFLYVNNTLYARKLIKAIDQNNIQEVEKILSKKGNVNSRPYIYDLDKTNFPPLTYAAYKGNFEIVKLLVEHGADVNNIKGTNQTSPLLASLSLHTLNPQRIDIAKYLVEHGADLNYLDRRGNGEHVLSALVTYNSTDNYDVEEEIKQYDFFLYLVERGADIYKVKHYGGLSYTVAAKNNTMILRYLVENEATNINSQTNSGYTMLMFAARDNARQVVEYLLHIGADSTLQNNDGETVYDIAVRNGNQEIINLLSR